MTHQVVATLAGHCWTFAEPAAPFRQTQENLGDVANQNLGVMIYIYLYDVYDTYDIYIIYIYNYIYIHIIDMIQALELT